MGGRMVSDVDRSCNNAFQLWSGSHTRIKDHVSDKAEGTLSGTGNADVGNAAYQVRFTMHDAGRDRHSARIVHDGGIVPEGKGGGGVVQTKRSPTLAPSPVSNHRLLPVLQPRHGLLISESIAVIHEAATVLHWR
jgi:hypothetical protein